MGNKTDSFQDIQFLPPIHIKRYPPLVFKPVKNRKTGRQKTQYHSQINQKPFFQKINIEKNYH